MERFKDLSISQLKRLIKSRGGRIAELEIEVKVMELLIEQKIARGEFDEKPQRQKKETKPEVKDNAHPKFPEKKGKKGLTGSAFEEMG